MKIIHLLLLLIYLSFTVVYLRKCIEEQTYTSVRRVTLAIRYSIIFYSLSLSELILQVHELCTIESTKYQFEVAVVYNTE